LGSYNYLGFAAADEYCTPRVIESLKKYSASTCSVRVDGGWSLCFIKLCHSLPWLGALNNISKIVSLFDDYTTLGNTKLHTELEELVARFVGKPAAILFGMGYVTNSAIIPALIGKVRCEDILMLSQLFPFYELQLRLL
jgi:serine palmitoyltransferase